MACARKFSRSDELHRLFALGKPVQNVFFYVVQPGSKELILQPIGVFGELLIGGVQVARGYLNRPELTAEKFIPNPWPERDPSGRGVLYRTGDRVRWCEDGELEFGGRIDFQVKLRGLRIELREIEHALRSQEGVTEAVVLLRDDVDGVSVRQYAQELEAQTNLKSLHELISKASNLRIFAMFHFFNLRA